MMGFVAMSQTGYKGIMNCPTRFRNILGPTLIGHGLEEQPMNIRCPIGKGLVIKPRLVSAKLFEAFTTN